MLSKPWVLWSGYIVIIVKHERKIVVTLRLENFIKHLLNHIHNGYVSWRKHIFQVHSSVKEWSEGNFSERYHRMSKQMELQSELKTFLLPSSGRKSIFSLSLFFFLTAVCLVKKLKVISLSISNLFQKKTKRNKNVLMFMSCFKMEITCYD